MAHTDEGFLVRFARNYGWRAYAIPVLIVISIWVLYDVLISPALIEKRTQPVASTVATVSEAEKSVSNTDKKSAIPGPNPASARKLANDAAQLPLGGSYTEKGDESYRTVGVAGAAVGQGREKTFTYVVEIENGIDSAAYGGDDGFAAMVDATLANPKGWTADSQYKFEHINDPERADLRIQLTSLGTTHKLCGDDIAMETSCFYSEGNRVVINESRWVRGAATFNGDLGAYRQYLINHEVGHGIGFSQHQPCARNGELAPIMMQQTLSLSNSELFRIEPNEAYANDNAVCAPNAWPYPRG
ncbi:DUF3152 domain-containing protein [Corynebacterium sp. sy017]|uniref:DUF3152 domain-containing protein n=1 Tax=unclassified Corynebacterium TaxID=2624378 RepID=UPI0011865E6E|nr:MULTISPECIES: DUF3152 domain-containing protein [unclassified Corynebacterium]MBP3088753.1 DUF3152 domain-containing protein [Corynebacterium sp. sy017]QDZ42146.1 DUF3152 domain-containing protein [Corynebacterium sp. sy039]TSD92034.1 DUF3152 domain-containing protein [Corynebacterium sp. SY003]